MAEKRLLTLIMTCCLLYVNERHFALANTWGTQFAFSLPNHMHKGGGDDVFFFAVSRFEQAVLHVRMPATGQNFNRTIGAGVTKVKIATMLAEFPGDVTSTGIYISSDKPISVHVMDFVSHNADGINLLPITKRGKEFYAMSYTPYRDMGNSQIAVTAWFQHTKVTVTVKTKTGSSFRFQGHDYTDGDIIRANLLSLQRMQLQHDEDLTGTHIVSDKPVSVITGSSCSVVPVKTFYCDCVYDQIPPVSSWGTSFIISKLRGRQFNRFRVLAANDKTTVTIGFLGSFVIGKGEFVEKRVAEDVVIHIEADKPILVVQLSESGEAEHHTGNQTVNRKHSGDPFMAVIPSIDHFSDGYLFSTPGHFDFQHVSIMIETSLTNGLQLNGHAVTRNDENTTYVLENGITKVYSVIRFDVKNGTYNLTHKDAGVRFGALLYGFDEYVSFGYSLGYRMEDLMLYLLSAMAIKYLVEGSRLVGGNRSSTGRLEVNVGGTWSGLCADGIDYREANVICRSRGYSAKYPLSPGAVHTVPPTNVPNVTEILPTLHCNGREARLYQCSVSLGYQHNCSTTQDVLIDCAPGLTDIVKLRCTTSSWLVDIDMDELNLRYPGSVASDIHLGDNSCHGTETGHTLRLKNDINSCFTSQTKTNGHVTYTNQLVYAYLDNSQPFIIRDFNWTLNLQCNVFQNGTTVSKSSYSTVSPTAPHQNTSSKYQLVVKVFTDPNYASAIAMDPIKVSLGTMLYVKTYVANVDWSVQMRLSSCYTSETHAVNATKYYLIKDGCEVDANTQLVSKSEHETKFQFQMFEMTTNHGSIYLHCDAVFCDSTQPASLAQCAHHCSFAG